MDRGLIEGIADYIRFRAGMVDPGWKWQQHCQAKCWNAGYMDTAAFLVFIEDRLGRKDFVSRLNEFCRQSEWSESHFQTLTGISLVQLWTDFSEISNE